MKGISPISAVDDLNGKRVLLRVDLNIPASEKELDHPRVRETLETTAFLRKRGASVVLLSHADPDEESLEPMANLLKQTIPLTFYETLPDHVVEEVVLLENLRRFPGEEANDASFAKQLASLGDLYVNDAFSVCHRVHASVVSLPKLLPPYAGPSLVRELEHMKLLEEPKHPFVAIVGGAKFETKLPTITRLLTLADTVFVLGALANTLLKERGYEIGRSLAEPVPQAHSFADHPRLMLPVDVVLEGKIEKMIEHVGVEDRIVDVGSETLDIISDKLRHAATVLWNGPLGVYEEGYVEGTQRLADIVGKSSAFSIVGGGDTLESVPRDAYSQFGFVSAGGGAMLEFLAKGILPGVESLRR